MTKEDYIEKINQNLEHLTKDELKDVSILTTAQYGVRMKVAEKEYIEKEIANLTPQLQQQALPVVPEFVAEWYEEEKDRLEFAVYDINTSIYRKSLNDRTTIEQWFARNDNKPIETVFKMKDGYIIEKPKLFRLKLRNTADRNHYLWLNRATNRIFIDKKFLDWTNHGNVKNSFTEQEISEILDGAFVNNEAFELVPVEDGE